MAASSSRRTRSGLSTTFTVSSSTSSTASTAIANASCAFTSLYYCIALTLTTDLDCSDNADWHGSDSENDSSDSEDDSGSDDGDDDENDNSDDEDDGVAPEETMEEEVAVQELVLTDAEQAALDAKRLAEEVSCPYADSWRVKQL